MKSLTVFTLGLLTATTVLAQEGTENTQRYFPQQLTAQELLTYCASSSLTHRGRQQQRYCWGFVSGVEEGIRLASLRTVDSAGPGFCVSEGETARELVDAYIRYAGLNTTDLTKPAARIVVEALKYAYRCPD